MNLTCHSALMCGLIAAFIFAQTPDAYAKAMQPQPQQSTQATVESRPVETVVLRLSPNSHETPQQVADDLKLLSPEEVSMLAANPQMMSVGGERVYVMDGAVVVALVVVAIILIVVIVAAAVH